MLLFRAHVDQEHRASGTGEKYYFAKTLEGAKYWACLWDDGEVVEIYACDVPDDTNVLRATPIWGSENFPSQYNLPLGDVDFTNFTEEGEIVTAPCDYKSTLVGLYTRNFVVLDVRGEKAYHIDTEYLSRANRKTMRKLVDEV